jgi:catechol 2,3-dioxygenase-like lactoylglutathione lyase family enzyme
MKRFHVHVAVSDLEQSIRFYSILFGGEPSVRKTDYAKWMLDDPRVNFAISLRGGTAGVNHLGLQVDTADELEGMREQLLAADRGLVEEKDANCCYARSDKYWVTDPAGIAWETFHSLGTIPVYGEEVAATHDDASARCCAPADQGKTEAKAKSPCCA